MEKTYFDTAYAGINIFNHPAETRGTIYFPVLEKALPKCVHTRKRHSTIKIQTTASYQTGKYQRPI